MEYRDTRIEVSPGQRIVAELTNPGSKNFMSEFPGCDKLGLSPDIPNDRNLLHAVIYALEAGRSLEEHGYNSAGFGKLEYMLDERIVDAHEVTQLVINWQLPLHENRYVDSESKYVETRIEVSPGQWQDPDFITRDIVASLTNPCSKYYMSEFPGCAKLRLAPDTPHDKNLLKAVIYALEAGRSYAECGDNSAAWGKLEYMIAEKIIDVQEITQLVENWQLPLLDEHGRLNI